MVPSRVVSRIDESCIARTTHDLHLFGGVATRNVGPLATIESREPDHGRQPLRGTDGHIPNGFNSCCRPIASQTAQHGRRIPSHGP